MTGLLTGRHFRSQEKGDAAMTFFWLHIKKAAGQTFRATFKGVYKETHRRYPRPFWLLPRSQWNDAVNNYRQNLRGYEFIRMRFVKDRLLSEREFERCFRFTIVRNPYARALSMWRYMGEDSRLLDADLSGARRSMEAFFDEVPALWRDFPKNRHHALHTRPIMPDLCDENGKLLVEYIGSVENLAESFSRICDELGIPVPSVVDENRSGDPRHYRDVFTPAIRSKMETLYGEDVERLGYRY